MGTTIPLWLLLVGLAAWEATWDGDITWERPTAYTLTAVPVLLAAYGMFAMLRYAYRVRRGFPSAMLVALSWQKLGIWAVLVSVDLRSLSAFGPGWIDQQNAPFWAPWAVWTAALFPDAVLWVISCFGFGAIAIVSLLFFFGRNGGVLDEPCDAVPFRPLVKCLLRKRRERRRG